MVAIKRFIASLLLFPFILATVMPAALASEMPWMPEPGTMVFLTPAFMPSHLRGMVIHPNDPFKFDFLIYRGDQKLTNDQKQVEYSKLIKYFLASLAIPDEDQWVNLSPYEKDRIIPDNYGLTEMGRDVLAQDYMLKQISSSLTNPDTDLGKKFWDAVYEKSYQMFGTTDIPTDTFNKVWIVPDKAVIFEKGNSVVVLEHHLKVMLESDYRAMKENGVGTGPAADDNEAVKISKDVMREVIIPAIEKEVNEGKSFAPLRQIHNSMLLAAWYKRALKESILTRVYGDRAKVKGIDQDPKANQEIFNQYVTAFKKGVFNMIKEDVDRFSQEVIPRKYFSGGDYSTGYTLDQGQLTLQKAPDSSQTQDAAGKVENDADFVTAVMVASSGVVESPTTMGVSDYLAMSEKVFIPTEEERAIAKVFLHERSNRDALAEELFRRVEADFQIEKNGPKKAKNHSTLSNVSASVFFEAIEKIAGLIWSRPFFWQHQAELLASPVLGKGIVQTEVMSMGVVIGNVKMIGDETNAAGSALKVQEETVLTAEMVKEIVSRIYEYETSLNVAQDGENLLPVLSSMSPNGRFDGWTVDVISVLGDFENVVKEMIETRDRHIGEGKKLVLATFGGRLFYLSENMTKDDLEVQFRGNASSRQFITMPREVFDGPGEQGYIKRLTRESKTDPNAVIIGKVGGAVALFMNGNRVDYAAKTPGQETALRGGIDFAQSNLDMQIKRDGAGVPLPISQQNLDHIRIDGLVPVILDIKPAAGVLNLAQ